MSFTLTFVHYEVHLISFQQIHASHFPVSVTGMMMGVEDWVSLIGVCRVEMESWDMMEVAKQGVNSNRGIFIIAGHQTEPTILLPFSHGVFSEAWSECAYARPNHVQNKQNLSGFGFAALTPGVSLLDLFLGVFAQAQDAWLSHLISPVTEGARANRRMLILRSSRFQSVAWNQTALLLEPWLNMGEDCALCRSADQTYNPEVIEAYKAIERNSQHKHLQVILGKSRLGSFRISSDIEHI